MHGRRILAIAAVALACARAAAPDPVAAVLAARGGPLPRFTRESELTVHQGFPGAWHWRLAFALPERLRMVLKTTSEDQAIHSDGTRVKTYLGNALVSDEPAAASDVPSLARFVALSSLDVLADASRVRWHPLEPAETALALRASFASHPEQAVRLAFDGDLRLVHAEGQAAIPGLGAGVLEARFADYRRVEGRWLPFEIRYRFRGAPLLDEHVVEWTWSDAAAESEPYP